MPSRDRPTRERSLFEEVAVKRLREHGFRVTGPRLKVVRALGSSHVPSSAQRIHESIVQSGERIDVVSVYRILATLHELGLIHHIGVVDGYIACDMEDEHAGQSQHVICETCGLVWELPLAGGVLEATTRQLRTIGLTPETVKVEILARCSACQSGGT